MSSYTHIPRIYICSPYTAVASRREARRIAIRALEEADEFFDSKGLAVELFSPVLANSVQYADRSYDEIMKICFMQIDTCGEIFIPSAKTCDLSLIAGSKGIGLEIDYAEARGYKIHNCEALRREKFLQNLKGEKKMSYKTELQELQRKLVEIKDKKKQAQKAFFKIAGEQIQDDFPFRLIQENSFETMVLSFSANGKFKCSKTITYDLLFLDNITFRLYHEKGQTEKVEKAKKSIKKLYAGGNDERD